MEYSHLYLIIYSFGILFLGWMALKYISRIGKNVSKQIKEDLDKKIIYLKELAASMDTRINFYNTINSQSEDLYQKLRESQTSMNILLKKINDTYGRL